MLSKSSTVHRIHVLSIAATTLVTQKIRCTHFVYHGPAYLQGEDCTIHTRNVGKDHFHLAEFFCFVLAKQRYKNTEIFVNNKKTDILSCVFIINSKRIANN
jgi:hypothetical protein